MIGFYFSGNGKMQLPVNPEKITVKQQSSNQITEVVQLGEINMLRDKKLASMTFDFLLPGDDYYPFIVGEWRRPEVFVDYFTGLMQSGRSVKFTVTDSGISRRVSVESFSYAREAGDHDSLRCSISLLEYRPYSAKTVVIPKQLTANTGAAPAASRPSDKTSPQTYTVKSGDSFWRIAQQQLGNGTRYDELAKLNGMTAQSVIHPGDVLKLPGK